MKKKLIKKVLVLLMATTMFTMGGCGNQAGVEVGEKQDMTTAQKESDSQNFTQEAVKDEIVTLTIGMRQDGNIVDFDTNYYTQLLEEAANVNLELIVFPADSTEFHQKLSLMVSGGSELPDVMIGGIKEADVLVYGESGILLPLNEYLNDPQAMPTFYENVPEEDRELMISVLTLLDGNIYGGPSYYPEIGNEYPYRAWINQTWLDTLGMDMPVTTEDFYNVLKAFKEKDPNGNGKKDEIPMIGAKSWSAAPADFLMSAFVYTDPAKKYLYAENGNIVSAFTSEEWKEGLAFINKLVSEDLLSPLSFTQDFNQLKAILNNEEENIVGCFTNLSMSAYTTDSANSKDMDVLPPLTGPEGACYAAYNKALPTGEFYITKYCDNIDAAIRLLDACYDKTISMVARSGEPEVDWSTSVGTAKSPYEASMGIKTGYVEVNTIWGTAQNKHWNSKAPRYMGAYDPLSIQGKGVDSSVSSSSPSIMTPKAVPYYIDKHPEELILKLVYTEEENTEVADLKAAIDTFVAESMVRFAVGEQPLAEWDNYINTLNDIGLERYLELVQAAYDRSK